MNPIKEIVINRLKGLLSFLEKKWNRSDDSKNTSPLSSLAPKILTEEKELNTIRPYLNSLKQAVDSDGINNIAIMGNYGSGKSTILKTFQHINPNHEYLNITLASFKDKEDESETDSSSEFEKKLEISILQQIFYHVDASQIPDSRFKRIINLTPRRLLFPALFFIIWLLSLLFLFKFEYIEKLNPESWQDNISVDWITIVISLLIFLTGIVLFMKSVIQLFKNSRINKLNIKGELELGDSIDKSVFNQYLEEILYFFERTKFNVVIIEDIDRFESIDIFTKLREINTLINNSNQIKRPIKFVYAIREDIFKDKSERIKFFDFIIPVIPFINPSNAGDPLTKLIQDAQLTGELTADFTSDVVTFIDDIDMRLLINIFNEYQIYRSILSKELSQDNLFAIIVYKNLHPDDFGELQKRKGKLYEFFSNKNSYSKSLIEDHKVKIKQIEAQIELLESEIDKPIPELRAVYINKLVSKLEKFHAFYIDEEHTLSLYEVLEDDYFEKIKTATDVYYIPYTTQHVYKINRYVYEVSPSSTPISSRIKFSDIEKEVSNKLTYDQREKLLLDKANNQINILKKEKDRIIQEINEVESMNIKDLFEMIDREEYMGDFKDNNLMRNLLLNGYINEHYDDYISIFHEITLTKDDFSFERKVKSGRSLPFDFKLTKTENIVKRLPDHYFGKETILNYEMIVFLLENEGKHSVKLEYFFRGLGIDGARQFEFIIGFIKNNPEKVSPFLKKLCVYKPSFWEYIHDKSQLPDDEVRTLLKHIFNYADVNSILNFNSIESLDAYIAQMDNFFLFCSSLEQTSSIQSFIIERKLLFENLDLPNINQKQLFKAVYSKNLYQLNLHNIYSIVTGNEIVVDENNLKKAHYTTLLKSGLKNLLSYIDQNIEDYIKQVLLLSEYNNDEDENTIVSILNRVDVSQDLKRQLVRSQDNKISSLELINDLEIKQIILLENKVTPIWENIFDYYDAEQQGVFDDVLVTFLNEPENYESLSRQKIEGEEREEDYIEEINTILLLCDSIDIEAYTELLDSLDYVYDDINVENLSNEKIEAIISKGILNLTPNSFDSLKSKGGNLHIKLIEERQSDFIEIHNELSLVSSDWIHIFQSAKVSLTNKLSLVQSMDDNIIINDHKLSDAVCRILPVDRYVPINYEVLYAMFNVHTVLSKKIALLNLNFNNLDDNQIQFLIETFGGDYLKMFKKQNKPKFPNNPQHIALFDKLRKRDLIIRYELNEDEKEIRVFAKY